MRYPDREMGFIASLRWLQLIIILLWYGKTRFSSSLPNFNNAMDFPRFRFLIFIPRHFYFLMLDFKTLYFISRIFFILLLFKRLDLIELLSKEDFRFKELSIVTGIPRHIMLFKQTLGRYHYIIQSLYLLRCMFTHV